MKTEQILLYAGGAFLAYKLFIAPSTTTVPTQALPVYTTGLANQPVSNSNTGSLIAAGAGTLATLFKNIFSSSPSTPATGGSSGSTASASTGSNDQTSIDNLFSSVPDLSNLFPSTGNSASNNFGLPTSFDFGSMADDDD